MYDLIADLFTQAQNLHVSATTTVLVDFHGTATLTNKLDAKPVQGPWCFTSNTLVYTPGGKEVIGNRTVFLPATFSQYPKTATVKLTISDPTFPTGSPAIQFLGAALVPTTPAPASPAPINVDPTTRVIYGVVVGGGIPGYAVTGNYLITITLCNLRVAQ